MFLKILFVFFNLQAQSSVGLSSDKATKCQRVLRAYCPAFKSITSKNDKFLFTLTSGEQVFCDDQMNYDMMDPVQYNLRINAPDLSSIIEWEYPLGKITFPVTLKDGDPGRIRYEPLLLNIYGNSETDVKKNLVDVQFLGKKLRINGQHGAADALASIGKELESIEGFQKQFWKSRDYSGAFSWRKIAGTDRLSVHSFGAAVDFTIKNDNNKKTYWLWAAECIVPGCKKTEENLIVIPVNEKSLDTFVIKDSDLTSEQVVSIFEKYGYIWGGKWHHFDTMHFEYRPEFLDFNEQQKCPLEDDFTQALTTH
jgi:peptidoglycan LD-endopeptidase CwlK